MRTTGLIVMFLVLIVAMPGCKGKDKEVKEKKAKPLDKRTEAIDTPRKLTRHPNKETKFVPTGPLRAEQSFHDYVVRIYEENWGPDLGRGSFEILKSGHRLFAQSAEEIGRFRVGTIEEDKKQDSLIRMGKDITGDGKPNLVISEWTGGVHCCFSHHVFEIGKEFRKIGTIEAVHDEAHFADMDGDSSLEVVLQDWTFAYWRAGFAGSPAPQVILRFRDGAYRVAGDLMRKPAPALAELKTVAQEVQDSVFWWTKLLPGEHEAVPSELWGVMLDLIYTGHAKLAWQFLEMAWPPDRLGKEKFHNDFRAQLSKSPYWPEIRVLNAD